MKVEKRTSDEDMRTTVLAVVNEEIRVGSFRRRVLARVRMRRSLRHLSSSIFPNSTSALINRRMDPAGVTGPRGKTVNLIGSILSGFRLK